MANLPPNTSARHDLIRQIRLRLGEGIVDVELDPEHYNMAIDKALDKYRQISSNSVEESYVFMEFQPDQSEYVLPREVIEVRQIFRRGVGGRSVGSGYMDPFDAAYTNAYLMEAGSAGGLLMFDLVAQYQELMGRMFGRDVMFKFNPSNHTLHIVRAFTAPESAVLWVYNHKPDDVLITNVYSRPWVRDWATAEAKMILGHAYSKFASIVGPGGGTSLNGETLKTEAQTEMEKLETEIVNYRTGEDPLSFVIG